MKTLALSNGDLVVGTGGFATVTGADKVRLELSLALGEYYGTDRFHADSWGSTVIDYVGQPIDSAGTLEFEVKSEVSRVIANYIAIQTAEIYDDYLNGTRSQYSTADVIRSVDSITAIVSMESINLTVALTTAAGQQVALNRTVSTS